MVEFDVRFLKMETATGLTDKFTMQDSNILNVIFKQVRSGTNNDQYHDKCFFP